MKRILVTVCAALLVAAALVMVGCTTQKETYTPPAKAAAVSDDALVQPGVLTIGVDTSQGKAPLAGLAGSRVVGLDVDLATWLCDEMGLKVDIVDVAGDVESALTTGRVDIVLGLPADTASAGIWKSNIYIPTGVALFATDPAAAVPADDSEPKIAAEAAKVSAWAVANEFGADALISGTDMGEVFEMLGNGSVDYAAADALIGMYAAHTVHVDAYVVALMQEPTGYCVGVAAGNEELQQAIASAMLKLSNNGIFDKMVVTKWLGKSFTLDGVPYTQLAQEAIDSKTDPAAEGGEGA